MAVDRIADELFGLCATQKSIDALADALADEFRQHFEMQQVPAQVLIDHRGGANATVRINAEAAAIDALHRQIETIIEGLSQ